MGSPYTPLLPEADSETPTDLIPDNGKAERFIQTALREWAYARPYDHSDQRTTQLPRWLHDYNWHRPHRGIRGKTPASKLALSEDNLLRLHT